MSNKYSLPIGGTHALALGQVNRRRRTDELELLYFTDMLIHRIQINFKRTNKVLFLEF